MKRLALLLFLLLLLPSCMRESVPASRQQLSYHAYQDVVSKTGLDSAYGIVWSEADAISMFALEGEKGITFTVTSTGSGGKEATFSGPSSGEHPYLFALSPASSEATLESGAGTVSASIPSVQAGVEGSFDPAAALSMAKVGDDGKLYFKNACALFSLTVPGNWITRIIIRSRNESAAMTGKALLDFNGGEPSVTALEGAKSYVELTVPAGSIGKRFYAAVYPGDYSDGFTITYCTQQWYNRYSSSRPLQLRRSSIVRIAEKNWALLDDRNLSDAGWLPEYYPWETFREGMPSFADATLVTLGAHNPNAPSWSAGRFAPHVWYRDAQGAPHWLFDAFLCMDTYDRSRSRSYCITNGSRSAVKASWEDLLEAWLGGNGAIRELDAAVSAAASELGTPPAPRYVIMAIPDPIMFENFADKGSSTSYWGDINGTATDFARVEDQIAACKWYMASCRDRFNSLALKNVELAGFCILSEELHLPASFYNSAGQPYDYSDTWNCQYKRWETIIPALSAYAHSCHEGLWWVPYRLAPGYRVWKELGIDGAFMQPNYYWDHDGVSHPLPATVAAMQQYGMGIELEFEYSMVADVMKDGRAGPDAAGNATFYYSDVPLLRSRLREYMSAYRQGGLYGVQPIVLYSGTDALRQLASSADAEDREMYLEICKYISDSPLKR